MLDRRTIVLTDGSVRSYFALPPDYQDFPPPRPPPLPSFHFGPNRFPPMSPNGLPFLDNNMSIDQHSYSLKRKFGVGIGEDPKGPDYRGGGEFFMETSSPFGRGRGEEIRTGKAMRVERRDVDMEKVKKAFFKFVRMINESESERLRYLENGKRGKLRCAACGRSSKDFPDTHALIMHAYDSDNADSIVDHLGLHKALCILMGWNYSKPPNSSKTYQLLPAREAAANQDDLIIWPPVVLIHNTITGKGKDGHLESLGNKAMDNKLKELGIMGSKSNKVFNKEGFLGITIVKFQGDETGLKEALQLSDHFEKENCGRQAWSCLQSVTLGKDDENNPNLVRKEPTGEKKRIWYGFLGTAADLHKVDYETRKRLEVQSLKEYRASK